MSYRLPTEAEWEFAARGGNKGKDNNHTYSGSNNIDEVAWHNDNSSGRTHPVGTKQPNELGIYDMSGNVLEWCSDWQYQYTNEAKTNPISTKEDPYRICRGGTHWQHSNVSLNHVRRRDIGLPDLRYSWVGFRVVHP